MSFKKWTKKKKAIVFGVIAATLAVMLAAGAVVMQITARRAKEAEKPYITLEANAVIDGMSALTGDAEFSVYASQPEGQKFASMSLVVEYGAAVTPCDVTGQPLPLSGTEKLPIPTITTKGFSSTAMVEPNAAGGGLLYFTITADGEALQSSPTFPMTTVKFKFDPESIQPWTADEKDGPYWVNNPSTGLFWFAATEKAATAPWSCRLFYASQDNLFYSSDATYEHMKDYTSVAPEKDFNSNKLSFDDTRTATQWSDSSKIRTRLVNEPTIARPIDEDEGNVAILFYDRTDTLIGDLIVPANQDARAAVNEYVKNNLVHPDLRNADVSSLAREDSYRGVIDNSATDGNLFALTNTFDYAFMKRPMGIIRQGLWEQKIGFDGKPEWDEEYPFTHGWAIVTNENLPQATPSIMGIAELAGYTGADPDTGAYVPQTAPQLTVSPVGYSHYARNNNGSLTYTSSINDEPLKTEFAFANFNFARVKPVAVSDSAALQNVMIVKACYEPGEQLQPGTYELKDVPYYNKARDTFTAEFNLTRVLSDKKGNGVHGIPLLREPAFVLQYINPYVTLQSYTPDEDPNIQYEVRYTEENGYQMLKDGEWVAMPDKMQADTVHTSAKPCVFPENDETEGLSQRAECTFRGYVDHDRSTNEERYTYGNTFAECETGYSVILWHPLSTTDKNGWEIMDYRLTETYGGGIWSGFYGEPKSTSNYDYADTCRWYEWEDDSTYDHDAECKLIHPYAPYLVPAYISPYEKGPESHLWNNLGDQIIPCEWMNINPDFPVPEKNVHPDWNDYLSKNGLVYFRTSGFYHLKTEVQVTQGDVFDLEYDTHWHSRLNKKFVTWRIEDESIASVEYDYHTGIATVTGIKPGRTTLWLKQGNDEEKIPVIVSPPLDGMQANDFYLLLSSKAQVPVTKLPTDTTNTVPIQYASSDPSIATVDRHGVVTTRGKPGYVTITATCGNLYSIDMELTVMVPFTVSDKNREKVGFTGEENEVLNIKERFVDEDDGYTYQTMYINPWAFYGETGLVEVNIPDTVSTIGASAFVDCENLASITLPQQLKRIGENAFQGCISLQTLYIPDSVNVIEDMAFEELPDVVYNGTAQGAPWGAENIRRN